MPRRIGSQVLIGTVVIATLLSPAGASRADDTSSASVPAELRPAPDILPLPEPAPSVPAELRPAPADIPYNEPELVRIPGRRPGRFLWVSGTVMACGFHALSLGMAVSLIDEGKPGAWLAVPVVGPIVQAVAFQETDEGLRVPEVLFAAGQVVGVGMLVAGLIVASRAPEPPDEPLVVLGPLTGPSRLGLSATGRF